MIIKPDPTVIVANATVTTVQSPGADGAPNPLVDPPLFSLCDMGSLPTPSSGAGGAAPGSGVESMVNLPPGSGSASHDHYGLTAQSGHGSQAGASGSGYSPTQTPRTSFSNSSPTTANGPTSSVTSAVAAAGSNFVIRPAGSFQQPPSGSLLAQPNPHQQQRSQQQQQSFNNSGNSNNTGGGHAAGQNMPRLSQTPPGPHPPPMFVATPSGSQHNHSHNHTGQSSHQSSTGSMSLQHQMLAQFSPGMLQSNMPPPPPAGGNNGSNVAGRRIILSGGSSASGMTGGGGSMGGSMGGAGGSLGRSGGGGGGLGMGGNMVISAKSSTASISNFSSSAAAAIGDTENDIKNMSPANAGGIIGGGGAGGKLRDPKDKGPKQCIVKFLAPQVTEQELRALFQQFGPVEYSRMIYDTASGSSKGYGFVYYYKSSDAADAVKGLDSFELYGRYLRVGFAIPQRQPPQQPASGPTAGGKE